MQIERGVVVQASFDDGVDLDRRQAGGDGRVYAAQDLIEGAEPAAHLREDFPIQRVQTDGYAAQAVGTQIDGMLPQQHSIRGQRDVIDARNIREIPDQVREVGAQQRFAARETQFAHAEAREQAREAHDLIEGQPFLRSSGIDSVRGTAPSACSRGSENCIGP